MSLLCFRKIVTELAGIDWLLSGPNQSSVFVDPSGDAEEIQNKWERFWAAIEALRYLVAIPSLWTQRFSAPMASVLLP